MGASRILKMYELLLEKVEVSWESTDATTGISDAGTVRPNSGIGGITVRPKGMSFCCVDGFDLMIKRTT